MILFSCQCGAAYKVDDKYAGGKAQCDQCGQHITVPQTSDPEVELVYKSGESEEGLAVRRDTLEEWLGNDRLTPADLIWRDGTWHPLSDYLGDEGDLEKGQAPTSKLSENVSFKTKCEAAESKDYQQILKELEPVSLPEEDNLEAKETKRQKGGFQLLRRPEEEQKTFAGKRSRSKRRVLIGLQVAAAILALTVGFKFGFGPLISTVRGKPTMVRIQNKTQNRYHAILGWRRQKRDIYPKSNGKFTVYVGMSEKQTLKLRPEKEGETLKTRLPLSPGGVTEVVVKPDGTFDIEETKPESNTSEKK